MGDSDPLVIRDDGNTVSRVDERSRKRGDGNRSKAARELIVLGDRVAKAKVTLYVGLGVILLGVGLAGGRLMLTGHTLYWQAIGGMIILAAVGYALLTHRIISSHTD